MGLTQSTIYTSQEISPTHAHALGIKKSPPFARRGEWIGHHPHRPLSTLIPAARDLDQRLGPALLCWVEDSDYFVAVGIDHGAEAWIIVNSKAAGDYVEGGWALRQRADRATNEIDAFASWSRLAPRAIGRDRLRKILGQDWEFAEDAETQLLDELGLPVESAQAPKFGDAILVFEGRDRHGAPQRFVPGYGQDFVGIWDREVPAAPIHRYPKESIVAAVRRVKQLNRMVERRGLIGRVWRSRASAPHVR